MDLEKAWYEVNFYLEHILANTKDLRRKVAGVRTVSETADRVACALQEIDIAEKELAEALRLSKSANDRLQSLFSHRQGTQDERKAVQQPV